jgi:hypothetical protein
MKQVELRLIPAPGQPPEFLAVVELVQKHTVPDQWEHLPAVVVLEGYTRDVWASDTSTKWITWQVESVDGRNKLPGFVKFLRDRQKTCYGRVLGESSSDDAFVWVISHKQMSSSTVNCRIASIGSIPNCPLNVQEAIASQPQRAVEALSKSSLPTNPDASKTSSSSSRGTATSTVTNQPTTTTTTTKKKKFGLLGNLVGAQKRTNTQMEIAASILPKKSAASASTTIPPPPSSTDTMTTDNEVWTGTTSAPTNTTTTTTTTGTKTAGQVLADFRQEMEQEMLDFDISSEPCLKVKIDLAGKLRLMTDDEKQTGKVTMEILKYIVYEQAEEVNEEWIAHREPSEFMDEVVITIYKEGEAPPEVLEDINKAELPDEVRGQQRAIQEQMQKAEQIKAQKLRVEQTRLAMQMKKGQQQDEEDEDFAALNTQKRDRRTIEDFEREAKRRRGEE